MAKQGVERDVRLGQVPAEQDEGVAQFFERAKAACAAVPLSDGATGAVDAAGGAARPYERDIDYLVDELRWLLVRRDRMHLAKAVRQALEASKAPDDELAVTEFRSFRGPRRRRMHLVDTEAFELTVAGGVEQLERLRARELALRAGIDARRGATAVAGRPVGLDRLVERHRLDPFDRLVVAVAVIDALELFRSVDFSLEGEFGLCWEGGHSVADMIRMADVPAPEQVALRQRFLRSGRLRTAGLIDVVPEVRLRTTANVLDARVEAAPGVVSEVGGQPVLDEDLLEFSSLEEPKADFEQIVLPAEQREAVLAVVEQREAWLRARRRWGIDDVIRYGRGAFLLFVGPPGTGKTMTAHALARRLDMKVLHVDLVTFMSHVENRRLLPGLFREARARGALLFFDECELFFASRSRGGGNALLNMLLGELERFEGVAVFATNMPEQLDEAFLRRMLLRVRFERPDAEARREIWRRHLPEGVPLADDVDLTDLARRFELTGGLIKNAVLVATAEAVRRHGEGGPVDAAALERAAAQQLRTGVEGSSDAAPRCTVRLADVVVPDALRHALAEIVEAARHLEQVMGRWGLARITPGGRTLTALFAGPPGTGKTLAARAIAAELSRPLRVGHLHELRSKWVGDSERNLAKLFERARAERAVLFLDEVDALAMARGMGAVSRHDDGVVTTLLGRIEEHEGLVILVTNRPEVLDPALQRRLLWRLHFPRPDEATRRRLWRHMLVEGLPLADDVDVEELAARYPLTGGQIRNAVMRAALRAAAEGGQVCQRQLREAAHREADGTAGGAARPVGFGAPR